MSSLFRKRSEQALALRERRFAAPCYRLIHGEADGLPGVVADRFGDTVVVQIGTAGMEAHLDTLVSALEATVQPANIVLRNEVFEVFTSPTELFGNRILNSSSRFNFQKCYFFLNLYSKIRKEVTFM